jgi:hypothetical protein
VSIKDKSNMCSRFSPKLPKEGLKDILSVLTVPLQRFPPFFLCFNSFKRRGRRQLSIKKGQRERESLQLRTSFIKISSRESQLITLLLLQMLFSSGRYCSPNFFNLGRVILVVSIPSSSFSSSSSIISSNCSQP